jgi:hypothetical protein
MPTTTRALMNEPMQQDMKASCQVRPTAMREAAAFHPAVPNAVENQYSGRLYQVHVLSSGDVGSRLELRK